MTSKNKPANTTMKRKHDLLLEVYSLDTSAIAVLSDIDMTNLPDLKALITFALMEEYDADTVTCNDIPEWVSGMSFPQFEIGYEVISDGSQFHDTVHITPIEIYS